MKSPQSSDYRFPLVCRPVQSLLYEPNQWSNQLSQFSFTTNQRSNQISGLRFRIFPNQRTHQRSWFKFNPNQSLSQISGLRFLPNQILNQIFCDLIFWTSYLVEYPLIQFKNIFVWVISRSITLYTANLALKFTSGPIYNCLIFIL